MLNLIKKMLGTASEQEMTKNNTAQEAHIALCVLLLEAAHVDGECSDEEMEHVISTLMQECHIPRQEIDELIAAGHDQRKDGVDLFRFTRYMNNNFTKDEKISVMESVWRIIHLDAHLEAHEDHFAHKLANLLRLTHSELMDAKMRVKNELG